MAAGGNFWIASDTGENMLRGNFIIDPVYNTQIPNPENPARLDDDYIIAFLRTNKFARMSFNDLYPRVQWTPEERERLDRLHNSVTFMQVDESENDDRFMHRMNTQSPIRTSGPNGGLLY